MGDPTSRFRPQPQASKAVRYRASAPYHVDLVPKRKPKLRNSRILEF